jgi:alkylated DNA repair protein alkB family protein 6
MTASPGRTVAAVPLAQLLLLPRSLLILSSSLYTSHLHGIAERRNDNIKNIPGGVANADLVGDAEVMDALKDGMWEKERGERISLTFRHAEKVVKGGALGMALSAMKRT